MHLKVLWLVLCSLNVVNCEWCKTSLTSVDAWVHRHYDTKGESFRNVNFNNLCDYQRIDVVKANITHLCEGIIKKMSLLESLSLIGVNLEVICFNAFMDVPRLKELSLSVNKLEVIRKGHFSNIPKLKILYLSKNRIDFIEEGAFKNFQELEAVHLDRNYLSTLNGNIFNGCPKIRLVDFRSNQIHHITDTSFEDLRPQHNKFLHISLKNNNIEKFTASSLTYLPPVELHLERNWLMEVDSIFSSAKPFSRLHLSNNKITCVSDLTAEEMRNSTKLVVLTNNPLDCACTRRIDDILGDEIFGMGELLFDDACVRGYFH